MLFEDGDADDYGSKCYDKVDGQWRIPYLNGTIQGLPLARYA